MNAREQDRPDQLYSVPSSGENPQIQSSIATSRKFRDLTVLVLGGMTNRWPVGLCHSFPGPRLAALAWLLPRWASFCWPRPRDKVGVSLRIGTRADCKQLTANMPAGLPSPASRSVTQRCSTSDGRLGVLLSHAKSRFEFDF